ncbi:MAG: hypothetical protein DI556_13060 [Rhodovulum sulfidophilum]|uniref:Uncharacterized protein n=1 Tax=Rhodovulum sulfidophilum TaxID=35806 RepID=A0A2W5N5H0_RHOSU|nr:MAG: hypothetical protein DI556_13060 [Rhodovulum sulfidophilum]
MPGVESLRVLRSEFWRRSISGIAEAFSLTMVVAVVGTSHMPPCAVAFVADGWRRRARVGLVISEENAGPASGSLNREFAALLDPPLTEAARRWRARTRIAFDLALQDA